MSKIKTIFTDSRPSVTVLRMFVKFWLISLKFLKKTVLVKKMMEKKRNLFRLRPILVTFGKMLFSRSQLSHFLSNIPFKKIIL